MDKELLIGDVEVETAPVELKRGTVTVKGLNRAEAIQIGEAKSILDRDRKLVSWGMVDPELTYQDVERWQKQPGSAGEIELVSEAIARLSGLLEGSDKEAYQRFPEDADA